MSEEVRQRMSYLDLLISTLSEHEKSLSEQIDRLTEQANRLEELSKNQKERNALMLKYYGQKAEGET